MAKTARTTGPIKASAPGPRRRGRPPESKSAKPAAMLAARKTRQPAIVAKSVTAPRKSSATPSAPKPSKGELQAQVEKLERTVATLRTRSRDAVRTAKQATAGIEELEAQLATMERQASKPSAAPSKAATRTSKRAAAAPPDPKPARSVRGRRLSAKRDPGDAVSPRVAVQDPEPIEWGGDGDVRAPAERLHPREK